MTDAHSSDDPYRLARFVAAQEGVYETALEELQRGAKRSHWMWFVFPQVAGLGTSPMAVRFAMGSRVEAEVYLKHPLLGPRLRACAQALLGVSGRTAREVMGSRDDVKLKSSMTLFAAVSEPGSVFQAVLDRYYSGETDPRTIEFLAADG